MTQGIKTRYHINGTTKNFDSRVELAQYFGCTVGAIAGAERRYKEKGKKSFWLKGQRIKRIDQKEQK